MPRRSSQQRFLPPIIIQLFGGAIIVAILVVGIVTLNVTILLAVFGFAGGAVMLGGYQERITHTVSEVLRPADPPDEPVAETRASDS